MRKKIIAINGSPRKNWNTHILINKALDGARDTGADTELINLYDLNYKGCFGCLCCKLKNSKSLGRCVVNDELKPVLDAINDCDGLILGSPIYFGDVTAMTKVFLERFVFQYLSYDDYSKSYFQGNIKKTALIFTSNAAEKHFDNFGYGNLIASLEARFSPYGYEQTLISSETLQVNDYNKYHMTIFNEEQRKERREKFFPEDCKNAYELGKSLTLD